MKLIIQLIKKLKNHTRDNKVNQEIPRAGSNSHSQAGETKGLCFLSLRTRVTWWKLKWDQKCPAGASDVEYMKPMPPNLSKGKKKGKKYLASIRSSLPTRLCLCLPLVKHWWRLSNRQIGKMFNTLLYQSYRRQGSDEDYTWEQADPKISTCNEWTKGEQSLWFMFSIHLP